MTYVAQALAAVESAEEQHRRGDRTAPFSPRFLALVRDDLDRMAASPNYQPTYPRFALDRPDSTGREMARFVFLTLKAASSPITFHEITQAQIKARGLKADDDTFVLMRKRVGACLTAQQEKRLVRSIPQEGPYKGWELIHSQAARADPFHQRRPSLRDRASLRSQRRRLHRHLRSTHRCLLIGTCRSRSLTHPRMERPASSAIAARTRTSVGVLRISKN